MELVTSFWSIQKPSTEISFAGITVPQSVSGLSKPVLRKPRFT